MNTVQLPPAPSAGPPVGPRAGPPRKPRWRRWYVLTPAGLLAAFIAMGVIGSVAAGSAKPAPAASRPSASAPAAAPKSAAYPAQAADKALCATFNADDTASIQAALDRAGGSVSPGLAKDVQAALDGSSYSQDVTAQIHVHMDCALVSAGKAPPAQGFSGAAAPSQPSSAPATDPAPAAPAAPVLHEKTLLTLSGNGSEDTAPFTVPDGSGNWKIIWTYNEGGFGQSVNFQIWSEDFQANVNKLGTGGSGTEYVYGDPGTHHLTVNSEGAWTIKVVTAP